MSRFYEPVPVTGGWYGRYGIRGQGGHRHRVFCRDMNLTYDQADKLCDILEEVRDYAQHEYAEE